MFPDNVGSEECGFEAIDHQEREMSEFYQKAHEALIEAYMETHPGVSWDTAYDRTADMAYGLMQDLAAEKIDEMRDRAKYE